MNADLLARCVARQNDVLRGHGETIGARMAGDTAVFMDLPATPFEPCDKKPARVSAFSLVRYRGSDYSVPTRFGHREVLVKGFVDAVVICHGADVIARHVRSYQAADFVFDPLHYLALLERKTGALDQAAPLQDWDLPAEFATLRRLLEARLEKRGRREFVQVLRLMEVFRAEDVTAAVRGALSLGAISFDAVKHLVLCRIEKRPPRLDLSAYPYLPDATVKTTKAADYAILTTGGVA